MVIGRLLSYWDGPFSGAMLNFGGVDRLGKLQLTPTYGWVDFSPKSRGGGGPLKIAWILGLGCLFFLF